MALRVELQAVGLQPDLVGRPPGRRPAAQVRRYTDRQTSSPSGATGASAVSSTCLHPAEHAARPERQRCGVRRVKVGVKTEHERILVEQLVEDISSDQRFQVDHLAGGEQILLLEDEPGVGDDEVGADDSALPHQLRENQDSDRRAPDAAAARNDEQVEVAGPFEIQVRDAARQRHHPHVGECADELQEEPMSAEERAAARLATPSLLDEIGAALGEKNPSRNSIASCSGALPL